MYYEDNEVVVLLVVNFELRRNYGMIWCPGPYKFIRKSGTFGWRSHLYYADEELMLLLLVHYALCDMIYVFFFLSHAYLECSFQYSSKYARPPV